MQPGLTFEPEPKSGSGGCLVLPPLWRVSPTRILRADKNHCELLDAGMVHGLITVALVRNFNEDIRKRAKVAQFPWP